MAYRLTHTFWLQEQVTRVRGVLLQNMDHTRVYTLEELLILSADLGLLYSDPEYVEIGQALLAEGFLQQV